MKLWQCWKMHLQPVLIFTTIAASHSHVSYPAWTASISTTQTHLPTNSDLLVTWTKMKRLLSSTNAYLLQLLPGNLHLFLHASLSGACFHQPGLNPTPQLVLGSFLPPSCHNPGHWAPGRPTPFQSFSLLLARVHACIHIPTAYLAARLKQFKPTASCGPCMHACCYHLLGYQTPDKTA